MNSSATDRMPWYLLIATSAATALAYLPSLFHVARSDLIIFLANTAGVNGWGKLISYSYAINRNPQLIMANEQVVFRPLYLVFWATEKYFFGMHFVWWQLTGIIVHLILVWRLYRLLMLISPGIPAAIATGIFSLLFSNIEGIIWTPGFILQCILMVIALEACLSRHLKQRSTARALWLYAVSLTTACFIYEFSLALSFVFFFFFLTRKKEPNRAAWLTASLAPCVIYFTASIGHLILSGYSPLALMKPSHYDLFKTAADFLFSIKWFFLLGTILFPIDLTPIDRLCVTCNFTLWSWQFNQISFLRLPGLLFLGCTFILPTWSFFKRASLPEPAIKREARLLSITYLLMYILTLTITRVHTSTFNIYASHLYYAYIFWLFWTIFCFTSIDLNIVLNTKPKLIIRALLTAILLAFVTNNVISIFQANRLIAKAFEKRRILIEYVDNFVKAHREEPDFSFKMQGDCPGNYRFWSTKFHPEIRPDPVLIEALYYPFMPKDNRPPQYILLCPSTTPDSQLLNKGGTHI